MYKRTIYLFLILILSVLQVKAQVLAFEFSNTMLSPTNIAYLESVFILCLLFYLIIILKKKKRSRKKHIETPDNEQLIFELKEKIKSKDHEIKEQDIIIDGLNIDIENLKTELDNVIKNTASNETERQAGLTSSIEDHDKVKLPECFYTKYADLLDGFSVAELVEEENNETIFEIRLQSPNKATFKVSENPAAQKYALTNADYFLQKTCVYDVVPFGKITTEREGRLSLSGGKWEIIEPAKISFK